MLVLNNQTKQVSVECTQAEADRFIDRVHLAVFRREDPSTPITLEQFIDNCEGFIRRQEQEGVKEWRG